MKLTTRPAWLLLCLCLPVLGLSAADNSFVLHDATPVRLRLARTLSSADAKVEETVDFDVLEDVKIGEMLVIARGATAIATVTQAEHKKRMARGGKLDLNIDYVRLVSGEKLALRAVKETSGGGHTGAMTGGIVATAIVFWPAAPFFLFMHGKDTTIPKGTEITAYTNGEIKLDPVKFAPAAPAVTSTGQPATKPTPVGPKLGNADITKLKGFGFSDDVIIAKIKASVADYKLDVNDLVELKQSGISDATIAAMLEASKR